MVQVWALAADRPELKFHLLLSAVCPYVGSFCSEPVKSFPSQGYEDERGFGRTMLSLLPAEQDVLTKWWW